MNTENAITPNRETKNIQDPFFHNKKDVQAVYEHAISRASQGEGEEAAGILIRLTSIAPFSGVLWRNLAFLLDFLRREKEALKAYSIAFSLGQQDAFFVSHYVRCGERISTETSRQILEGITVYSEAVHSYR